MKRYAASYLYLSKDCMLTASVIEIENGIVRHYFPLTEEIHSTIWLPGVLILSAKSNGSQEGISSFQELLTRLLPFSVFNSEKGRPAIPLYIYHVYPINLLTKELLPGFRLQLLS